MTYLQHANLPPLVIKKEFADSNDVCLLYEMTYREPPVTTFVCGWFHVNDDDDDGKISSLRFVMDPRQLFQQKKIVSHLDRFLVGALIGWQNSNSQTFAPAVLVF